MVSKAGELGILLSVPYLPHSVSLGGYRRQGVAEYQSLISYGLRRYPINMYVLSGTIQGFEAESAPRDLSLALTI